MIMSSLYLVVLGDQPLDVVSFAFLHLRHLRSQPQTRICRCGGRPRRSFHLQFFCRRLQLWTQPGGGFGVLQLQRCRPLLVPDYLQLKTNHELMQKPPAPTAG